MNRTERSARILMWLVTRRRMTTREAADLCGGVSVRCALDDLRGLKRLKMVAHVGHGRKAHWVLRAERGLAPLDRISLVVGREVTRFLEGTSLHRGIERLQELHADDEVFAERVRYHPEPARTYAPRDEIVDACLDGLLRTRTLTIRYDSSSGGSVEHFEEVEPLTLVVYRRALYILGRLGRNVYTLAVDRMLEVEVGSEFEYPRDWNVDGWLDGRFGLTAKADDAPMDVVLRFSSKVAHLVRAREWHHTQDILPLADGEVMLRMQVKGHELARFVLEWGEHCEVLGPQSLRDRVVTELRNALARYERRP